MENSGEQIIEQLRQKAQEDAHRKSQQIRTQMFCDPYHNTQNIQKPINIFANSKKAQTKNLFGDQRKSINLFNVSKNQQNVNLFKANEQGAKNIFNMAQKPAIQDKDDEQSLSQASSSIIKSQFTFKTQPDLKEMKYQYKKQLQKIGQFQLRKFKNGISPAKDDIYVTLEKLSDKSGILYMFVRNNSTKISIFQGIMMKNISNPQNFMGKQDNIRFEILKQNRKQNIEGETKTPQVVKEMVKLQFINGEQCEKFLKQVRNNL